MKNNRTYPLYLLLVLVLWPMVSCVYVQKIRDGKTAYERKQYKVAIGFLEREYQRTKSRIEKGKYAYMLGESYKNTSQNDEAIDWYLRAYDSQYGVDALREYAYALKQAERYDEAIQAFKNLGIEIGSPYEYRREITACQTAKAWANADYKDYTVEALDLNTASAEYAPSLYRDNQLIFTSDRGSSTGDDTYNWTGSAFSDLFVIDREGGKASNFDKGINTSSNEGTICFNTDYTETYFTRCDGDRLEDHYCKIMGSEFRDNGWTVPQVLDFVEEKVNYMHPSLSSDGNFLYFSAKHPDGWGGYDIYVSERSLDGWLTPKLLGRVINSEGNEQFPFVDGDTLYFASNYHTGMGGLDIFKTYKMNGTENWAPLQNLKAPLNSSADDFGLVIDYQANLPDKMNKVGYFSSNRPSGAGKDDIYRFFRKIPPPPPPIDTTKKEEPKPIVYQTILNVYVVEKIYEDPNNPDSKVLGRKPLSNAKVQVNLNGQRQQQQTNEEGLLRIEVTDDADYYFFASYEGYLNQEARFSSKGIGKDPNNPTLTFEVEMVLDKIFANREIVLDNIYYDFDKWDIRSDAQPTLNELAYNLQLNPAISIELASHTDCQGNAAYNESLSQKRAQSAVDYLIAQGIEADRLTAKGYGENELLIDCVCNRCTEEEHQANRRTTFKIVE